MDTEEISKDIATNSEVRKNNFMRMSRRSFLKMGALTAGALSLANLEMVNKVLASTQVPQTPLLGASIPKYVDPLPVFGPAGPIPRVNGDLPVTVTMQPFAQGVLSTGTPLAAGASGLTNVWAYNINGVTNYPAVTVEANKGKPTQMTYDNKLTSAMYQYLTVDQTLHWANPLGTMGMPMGLYTGADVPAVVHLHGGEVPATVDGGPDAWWTNTPSFLKGSAYFTDTNAVPPATTNQAVYTYPNVQGSTTLFFHDHALGATRLNVYAGLAAFYLIRDQVEAAVTPPLPSGKYEIEIAIQDRMFDNAGQWLFPDIGVNPEHPFWVPEFFGDAIVVNGKTWPYLNVEPRRYRLRFVNGSNARFYNLRSKVEFWQIGTDGGLLDTPVKVNNLLLAPGERADVIVDFFAVAQQDRVMNITVTNNAATPYPVGLPVVKGTTDQILQFRVGKAPLVPIVDPSFNPTKKTVLRALANKIVRLVNPTTGVLAPGVIPTVKRSLTLNEWLGPAVPPAVPMPLEMLLNNTKWSGLQVNTTAGTPPAIRPDFTEMPPGSGMYYSEIVNEGTTEVWEIINLTVDAHPMHLHLVQFQLMNRQALTLDALGVPLYAAAYGAAFPGGAWIPEYGPPNDYRLANGAGYIGGNPDVTPFLAGPILPPNQNERGWKDTVVMMPGQVTRIAVRFAPLDIPVTAPVGSLVYPFNPNPTGNNGYVWHCHIIDHEDNEMMRPYMLIPAAIAAPNLVPTIPLTGPAGTPVALSAIVTYGAPNLTGTVVWTATPAVGAPISIGTGLAVSWTPPPLAVPGTPELYTITATATDSRGSIVSVSAPFTAT